MSLTDFMTETCTHKNNPTGAATLSTVASAIACTPLDPASVKPSEDYPVDKMFLLKETFTKYTAFQKGDFIEIDSVEYPILAAHSWGAQGGLDAYYHIIAEEPYGS